MEPLSPLPEWTHAALGFYGSLARDDPRIRNYVTATFDRLVNAPNGEGIRCLLYDILEDDVKAMLPDAFPCDAVNPWGARPSCITFQSRCLLCHGLETYQYVTFYCTSGDIQTIGVRVPVCLSCDDPQPDPSSRSPVKAIQAKLQRLWPAHSYEWTMPGTLPVGQKVVPFMPYYEYPSASTLNQKLEATRLGECMQWLTYYPRCMICHREPLEKGSRRWSTMLMYLVDVDDMAAGRAHTYPPICLCCRWSTLRAHEDYTKATETIEAMIADVWPNIVCSWPSPDDPAGGWKTWDAIVNTEVGKTWEAIVNAEAS